MTDKVNWFQHLDKKLFNLSRSPNQPKAAFQITLKIKKQRWKVSFYTIFIVSVITFWLFLFCLIPKNSWIREPDIFLIPRIYLKHH